MEKEYIILATVIDYLFESDRSEIMFLRRCVVRI